MENTTRESLSIEAMKKLMQSRAGQVNAYLEKLPWLLKGTPAGLMEAMQYSLTAGGKRLRPVLCLSCASLCGLDISKALPFASAIEMIHTYSLIHDDLPAMDDDDTRRGKPTSHKAFGEATAILAGDGLLTDAFLIMCQTPLPAERVLPALSAFALASGSSGMVGGQMLDMVYTGSQAPSVEELFHMQALKTGAIIQASCVCGGILAGASSEERSSLAEYGKFLGSAFQIADDILDIVGDAKVMGKAVGKDEGMGKLTGPAMLGVEKCKIIAQEYVDRANRALSGFSGEDAAFLRALSVYVIERAS